eukprot:m.207815 g.207815  ORF g.207815 m.207815 type:complete len:52 (+) comp32994_c2_seq7:109-264(+)
MYGRTAFVGGVHVNPSTTSPRHHVGGVVGMDFARAPKKPEETSGRSGWRAV